MISKNASRFYRQGELHLIENYEEAVKSSEKWSIHHRLELTLNGEPALKVKDLIRLGMYFDRPYFELIFLKDSNHKSLHSEKERNLMFGKPSANRGRTPSLETCLKRSKSLMGHLVSEETRRKLSQSKKGVPNFAARKPKSEETKRKLSLANLGKKRSPESIEKQKRSAAEYFKNRRLKNGNAKET